MQTKAQVDPILIRPGRFRQFGPAEGTAFCLITNPDIADYFQIVPEESGYNDFLTLTIEREEQLPEVMSKVPEQSHMLVCTPSFFILSPHIGPKQKLIAMACNSTDTSVEVIRHFIRQIERTDPHAQLAMAERFFELGESTSHFELVDEVYGTRATFNQLSENNQWHQQAGPLDWGEQQIAPAGEISVLPLYIFDFDYSMRLEINGEIAFRGLPIVHHGKTSFLPQDQDRIYEKLNTMREHAIIARIQNAMISEVYATHPDAEPAAKMLQHMFEVDSRYRIIWEMGFAINTTLELLWGNNAMNEVYGAADGCMHFGLGLTPFTQYHIDIINPGTRVYGSEGQLIFGTPPSAS
jgi:hypothetical protein